MATCKDCMHYSICEYSTIADKEVKCKDYIYKIDCVEVVRCKDCLYCEECHYEEDGEKPYIKLKCKWSNYSHHPNDYCSLGEKKNK